MARLRRRRRRRGSRCRRQYRRPGLRSRHRPPAARPRHTRALGVVAVSASGCVVLDWTALHVRSTSVWIPRYFGVVYPAVVVGAAALLWRVRWPAVRWATVGLLLAVNLARAAAHVFVANEPPVDRIAADVVAADGSAGRTVAIVGVPHCRFGPHGMGTMYNTCGKYYLVLATGRQMTPAESRRGQTLGQFPTNLTVGEPTYLVDRAAFAPAAMDRLIVWSTPGLDRPGPAGPIAVPGWPVRRSDVYPVRSFWDWGTLYEYRRTVYAKAPG